MDPAERTKKPPQAGSAWAVFALVLFGGYSVTLVASFRADLSAGHEIMSTLPL
jgi:hypothetical protein